MQSVAGKALERQEPGTSPRFGCNLLCTGKVGNGKSIKRVSFVHIHKCFFVSRCSFGVETVNHRVKGHEFITCREVIGM